MKDYCTCFGLGYKRSLITKLSLNLFSFQHLGWVGYFDDLGLCCLLGCTGVEVRLFWWGGRSRRLLGARRRRGCPAGPPRCTRRPGVRAASLSGTAWRMIGNIHFHIYRNRVLGVRTGRGGRWRPPGRAARPALRRESFCLANSPEINLDIKMVTGDCNGSDFCRFSQLNKNYSGLTTIYSCNGLHVNINKFSQIGKHLL